MNGYSLQKKKNEKTKQEQEEEDEEEENKQTNTMRYVTLVESATLTTTPGHRIHIQCIQCKPRSRDALIAPQLEIYPVRLACTPRRRLACSRHARHDGRMRLPHAIRQLKTDN